MTIRKNMPSRNYDTFSSNNSDAATSDPDKTRSAAHEAQRLASQGSWGDNLMSGRAPSNTHTPSASTVDESEDMYTGNERRAYPDPPPLYTPSATTDSSVAPSSPVAARASPDHVGHPTASPIGPSSTPPAPRQHQAEEETSPAMGREDTTLLEPDALPPPDTRWAHNSKNHRVRRLKKACWFSAALALCLWLMIPYLLNCDKARTQNPPWHHKPSDPVDESPIPTWPIPRREFRQHETSNSIVGTFQLYDLLDLSTSSGSISVTVNPQEGAKPAVLRLSSSSGSVNVRMGLGVLGSDTNRTFVTDIRTSSGSVSGSLMHGNGGTTDVKVSSSSINLNIDTIGVGEHDPVSRLTTTSQSGSQGIRVSSSGWGEKVKAIQASHIARGSASLNIDYPRGWEGKVHVKSYGSGGVDVYGSDLKKDGGGKDIYAWRGEKNLQEIEVLGKGSGHISFNC